jgi:hypothetical protein
LGKLSQLREYGFDRKAFGMDALEQLKLDMREVRIGVERLFVVATLQQQLQLEELEQKGGGSAPAKVAEPFSMRTEQKRQQARHKMK